MAGELAFFELGVEDADQARAFYEGLFGWRFEPGPGGDGFTIDGAGIPGGVHGGDAGAAPYVFFRVEDMNMALARVRELGGTTEEVEIDRSEELVARYGHFVLCHDDQGSRFGLHQPPA